MIDSGLAELERAAGAILAKLSSSERRAALRKVGRTLRASQAKRIGAQTNPDGSRYVPRKPKHDDKIGKHPVKFLYPKDSATPRLVLMKEWREEGPRITGLDIEVGAERSFLRARIDRFLPLDDKDAGKPAGTLRRRGAIRREAMFRKMRGNRTLRSGASDEQAWIGFSGRAAAIGRVHQMGLQDRPARGARPVRYPRRELIGLTEAERTRIVELMLEHVAGR